MGISEKTQFVRRELRDRCGFSYIADRLYDDTIHEKRDIALREIEEWLQTVYSVNRRKKAQPKCRVTVN